MDSTQKLRLCPSTIMDGRGSSGLDSNAREKIEQVEQIEQVEPVEGSRLATAPATGSDSSRAMTRCA